MEKKYLRGYTIYYEDNAFKGVEHLSYVLSFDESESFFNSAFLSGKINFEDRVGRNYTLISKSRTIFEVKIR